MRRFASIKLAPKHIAVGAALAGLLAAGAALWPVIARENPTAAARLQGEWPGYGYDQNGRRHSPLTQISRAASRSPIGASRSPHHAAHSTYMQG